jgi:hypothetical protein
VCRAWRIHLSFCKDTRPSFATAVRNKKVLISEGLFNFQHFNVALQYDETAAILLNGMRFFKAESSQILIFGYRMQ